MARAGEPSEIAIRGRLSRLRVVVLHDGHCARSDRRAVHVMRSHARRRDLRTRSHSDRPLRRHVLARSRPSTWASRRCKGLLGRTGVRPDDVEDVILGHCYPSMEAPAIGRVVALDAGLPVTVPGMQLDRRCGSGLQAVIQGCMQVATGQNDLVVAGGAESMSNVVFHSTDMRWGGARGGVKVHDALSRGRTTAGGRDYPVPGGMLETAENLRRQYGIPREEQDELAVTSHRRAVAAQKDGLLADQIIPVTVTSRAWRRRDRHRRASARRHHGGGAEQAQTHSGEAGSGSHRHRRATPAGRTTRRRCASSPRSRRQPSWG